MEANQTLELEQLTYEEMKQDLEAHHFGKFAIIKGNQLAGVFDSFDAAAREAIKQFGKGPYLIRQVGVNRNTPLPASVAYRPLYAHN